MDVEHEFVSAPIVSHLTVRIPYTASNFPTTLPANLSGSHTLTTSWMDLVWSAITTGKPGASHLLTHRWHSLADSVVRSYTIYANLRQLGQYIGRSSLYESLDPTEKSATSYFLGMTMAKLFAAKRFETPWLFHVSQATAGGAMISFKRGSKSQPDLIGLNRTGDWIVVEAKGRTHGLDAAALAKAKLQTSMIRSINGVRPHLQVALQAFFDNHLSVYIDDPSDARSDGLDLDVDVDAALSRYYAVAMAMATDTAARETIHDQVYAIRFDDDSGITIGLESSILSNVTTGKFEQILANQAKLDTGVVELDSNAAVYPDGLFVRLDARWSPELMALEPENRGR